MKEKCLHIVLIVAVFLTPNALFGALRGDTGWSDDGKKYGFCDPEIMPDAPEGCIFFDTGTLEWVEVGRREAMKIWKVWKPAAQSHLSKPLLPVYPLDEKERSSGIVKLSGRITSTDDVVEIWRLKRGESPDEMGSQWETLFDYSPDGTWLAAGALRVDFSDSKNLLHVIVRPVNHWLVVSKLRAGLDKLSKGQFIEGLAQLSKAGSLFEKVLKKKDEAIKAELSPPRPLEHFIEEDISIERSWIEKKGIINWSSDGKKLCLCDAWEDDEAGNRASCRYFDVSSGSWNLLVAEKTRFVCPKAEPASKETTTGSADLFWLDWGRKDDDIKVVVYIINPQSGKFGAVMKKDMKYKPLDIKTEGSTEPIFHTVALPSPAQKNIAVGFAKESADHRSLHYFIEVDTLQNWKKKGREDRKSFKQSKAKVIEKVPGIF